VNEYNLDSFVHAMPILSNQDVTDYQCLLITLNECGFNFGGKKCIFFSISIDTYMFHKHLAVTHYENLELTLKISQTTVTWCWID